MSPGNLRLLEGSKFRIAGNASEDLGQASLVIKGSGEESSTIDMKLEADRSAFSTEVPVPASGWKSMMIKLATPDGRVSVNEPVYRIDLITDHAPTVSLTLPKKDRVTVTPGTKVTFGYRAADDFGLQNLELRYRIFRPGLSGTLMPAEERSLPVSFDRTQKMVTGEAVFDLDSMVPPIPPGCSVTCWMEALDTNPAKGGSRTLSKEKVVAVVTEAEKRMELLEQMEQRAKDIDRLYDQQRRLNQPAATPR